MQSLSVAFDQEEWSLEVLVLSDLCQAVQLLETLWGLSLLIWEMGSDDNIRYSTLPLLGNTMRMPQFTQRSVSSTCSPQAVGSLCHSCAAKWGEEGRQGGGGGLAISKSRYQVQDSKPGSPAQPGL